MVSPKPRKPESSISLLDALAVSTWQCQFKTNLSPIGIGSPQIVLGETASIAFASTMLRENAVKWWFMLPQHVQPPNQAEKFKNPINESLFFMIVSENQEVSYVLCGRKPVYHRTQNNFKSLSLITLELAITRNWTCSMQIKSL